MSSSPFSHTHVSHLVKKKRRRSQSLTLPNFNDLDSQVENEHQRQFLSQLKKERQKQKQIHEDEDDFQPTVTRIPRTNTSVTTKKHTLSTTAISVATKQHMSSTTIKTTGVYDTVDDFQPSVTRVNGTTATASTNKQTSTKKEMQSVTSKIMHIQEDDDEEYDDQRTQVTRMPRTNSTKSLKNQFSNASLSRKYLNTKSDTPISHNDIDFNSSQTSYNPLATSTSNIISKSSLVDQEFRLDDGKEHARRNDVKSLGSVKINERENYYAVHGRKLSTKSSASFMAAVIAIIIGIIAFALALTAFILLLLLRSTVEAQLSNSTSKTYSGSLPTECSTYTTVDDPTRSINAPGYALGCDNVSPFLNRSQSIWIRFIGTGGTTLPLTTPGMNICGSQGTGWYYGTMPSTGQLLNGTACFTWDTSVCRFSASISVANCGSFYIYLLPPPPACMMRYCTI
ncbi:hypothetical protein I4U23_026693 [Adineta vaga]|nr:hypothetical protein I4U23_026693 [Adineta vaga]